MNKKLYRVIFNKKRGLQMVVAEMAKTSGGKEKTATDEKLPAIKSLFYTLKPITLFVSLSLGFVTLSSPVYGASNIVADKQAAKHQQPQVINTANGITQVNIQTPNNKGVSHNKYRQFDVAQQGAILNNSSKISQTQIAGHVQGNEFLKNSGPAKIILNEVNSRNPSQLNGVLEVAGQKAQVIIANPSGITCNGCGFINASRSTLTTGKPILQNGDLTGYQVEQGKITVTGKGLDSSEQSYTDLISHTVSVNSAIWANELNVVTGKNRVSQDSQTVEPLDDTNSSERPEVSIDVSQFGGMYAGSIRMVGTEKGVGVHNAGELGASINNISISAEGKITNRGAVQATKDIQISSRDNIDNQKQIYSKQNIKLNSGKTINNDGTLIAQKDIKLSANNIHSQQKSAIIAGIDTQGKLTQSGHINADANVIALNGQNKAGDKLSLKAKQAINLDDSQTYANEINLIGDQLSIKSAHLQTEQQLNLNHTVSIDTSNATLQTKKGIAVSTETLTNNNGTFIAEEDIAVKANHVQSQAANILTYGKLTIDADDIDMQKAALSAKDAITVSAGNINADELALITEQDLKIKAQNLSVNQADLQAKKSIHINANNLYAQYLKLLTTDALSLKANHLVLNYSQISALGYLDVAAKTLQNKQSRWIADKDINVKAEDIDNQSSQLKATGSINYLFTHLNNNDTVLVSGQDLIFTGDKLQNINAKWQSGHNTTINITGLFDNQSSLIVSKGELAIRALTINNNDGDLISGKSLTINSKQLASENSVLQAEQALKLTASEQFDGQSATLYSDQQIEINSDKIDLNQAYVGSKGDITLKGQHQQLNESELLSNGQIAITAANIHADDAIIKSAKDIIINALAFVAFNRAQLVTNQQLKIKTEQADTAESKMYAKSGMHIDVTTLNNQHSNWLSESTISLFANQFNNQKSILEAKQNIDIDATQFNNQETVLLTDGRLIINATDIDNTSAQIQTKDGITINANNQLFNDNTKLITENDIDIHANVISNTHAQLSSNQSIAINAQHLYNQHSTFFTGGKINVTSNIINNEKSEIKATQGIDIQTDSLASDEADYLTEGDFNLNSQDASLNKAKIASKGNMHIVGEQTLSMQEAQLTSLKNMQINANTLNSSASDIYSLGNIDITAQTVKNDKASLISDQDITIHADTIDTTESEIGAEGDINVSAITLNNNKAKWIAKKAISINAQQLANTAAQLASHQSLNIHAKQIDNQHAVLSAKETIAIDADELDNSQAKLFSDQSVIIAANHLINREGVIKAADEITINSQNIDNNQAIFVAEKDIQIHANTLNNTKAALQSQSQIVLKADQLNNESALLLAGDKGLNITSQNLNNQQAQLYSKGDLTIDTQSMDNQHAKMIAEKALNIHTDQLNNQYAELQAKGNITIDATEQNNQQATILSENDIKLKATESLDNRDAQFTANGLIDIQSTHHIDNSQANLLSNKGIVLKSANVINQSATLKTNGLIDIKANSLDNQASEYQANNIVLEIDDLNNQQAKLTANQNLIINAQDFDNRHGHLLANDIYLKTKAYRGDGTMKSQNNLSLDLQDSFINESELSANGHLAIRTQKDIVNKNKITAGQQVSLESQQLTNEQHAEISAEYLSLKHQNVTNHGLIDATTAVMRTHQLDNLAGGRIYADNLAIHANILNNLANNNMAPVIAARQNFHLGVGTLNNYAHAQLLSLGNFVIGGELDENWSVTGSAKQINNHSATIEAQGDLYIATNELNNMNDHIVTEMRPTDEPPETETYFQTSNGDGLAKYSPNEVTYRIHRKRMPGIACQSGASHKRCFYWWNDIPEHLRHSGSLQRMSVPSKGINGVADSWEFNVIKHKYRTVILETDPSKISAAGNVIIHGQTINNQDSKIVAGNTVNINATQLNNHAQEAVSKYVYSGSIYLHKRHKQDKYGCYYQGEYNKADEIFVDNALNKNIVDHQIVEKTSLTEQPHSEVNVENKHNQVAVDKTVNDTLTQQAKVVSAQSIAINSNQSDRTHIKTDANHQPGTITSILPKPTTTIEEDLPHQENNPPAVDESTLPEAGNDITPSKTISVYEPDLTLPDNSLWIVNKEIDKNYIVETDPRFTNRKKWLSSDYMINRLSGNPDSVLKRLGDGYYEQQLIQQQIVGLTGHRYLHGYKSDMEQYQALMDAGISFAKEFGIAIGVELTGEQMRALTNDIVLLVKKSIMVNGQPTEVLVPQVYMVNRPQLGTDGALIAGDNIFVKGEQLNNTGLIAAKQDALLQGHDVTNKGTIYGDRIQIEAENDITNLGHLFGDKLVYLSADNDINLLSSTRTQTRDRNRLTNIDQASTILVNNGNIVIDAGHDINAKAGYIVNNGNEGNTWLQAGHNIGFTTAELEEKFDITSKKDYRRTNEKSVVGTQITAANNVQLTAGNDITAKTVDIATGNHLGLQAGNDISIEASKEHFDLDEFHKSKSKGFLSKTKSSSHTVIDNNTSKGSELSANSVTIKAGHDLDISGSMVIGAQDVYLNAGNNVNIEAAEETYYRYEKQKTKTSGVSTSSKGISVGSQSTKATSTSNEVNQSQAGSLVGTSGGNVIISANKQVTISGSDIIAGRAEGDDKRATGHIDISGEDISIIPGHDIVDRKQTFKSKSSGVGISFSNPITESVQNIHDIFKSSGNKVEKAKQFTGELAALAMDIGNPVSSPISYHKSSTKSQSSLHGEYSSGSTLTAAGNIQLHATNSQERDVQGQLTHGDVVIKGSDLTAGEAIIIDANRHVAIETSADKQSEHSKTTSKNWSATTAAPTAGSSVRFINGSPNHGAGILPYGSESSGNRSNSDVVGQNASTLTANNIAINSREGNIDIKGSLLNSQYDINLHAANGHVDISASTNQSHSENKGYHKVIGELGGDGYSGTVGYQHSRYKELEDKATQSNIRSGLNSTKGNINVVAGDDVKLAGVDISAGKSVNLTGKNVIMETSEDSLHQKTQSSNKQYGVTVSTSGYAVTAAQSIEKAAKAIENKEDKRLAAIYMAQAGVNAAQANLTAADSSAEINQPTVNAENNANANDGGSASLIKVNVSVTADNSKQKTEYHSNAQTGTVIHAGQNVNINAEENIEGKGVDITGQNINLNAGNDIKFDAAHSTEKLKSTDSGSHYGAGVGFGLVGGQNGFSIELAASKSKGKENGTSDINHNSTITASNTLNIQSGRDVILTGAELSGEQVIADIGRNLTISSEQDKEKYDAKHTSVGASASICVPPFCYGASSASANFAQDKMKSDYESVNEQSGIFAGSGGYDITVGEHTQLNGAVIASKADSSKNRLDTGTIGFTDIENKAEYDVSSISGSVGVSKGQDSGGFSPTSGQPTIYDHNDEASNITHAAISDGELIIRDQDKQTQDINELSHDTENAHSKLKPIFNKEDEQTRLNIVTSLKELGEQVKELERTIHKDAGKDSQDGKMGNDFSKGVDSAVSIITGIITGDMTGGLAGASAPWLAEQIKLHTGHLDKDGKWQTDDIAGNLIAHAILGAVVAELQGNSGLAGGAGAVAGEVAADIIRKQLYGKEVKDLTEEEKQTISALSQLAAGLAVAAGGSVGDAGAAISSSKNAVENNGENLGFDFFFSESKMKAQYNCYTDDICNNLDDNAREHAILEQSAEIQKEIIEPYKEAGELLANIENTLLDFTPIIGDAKAFAEAEDVIDYTIASVGLIPGVGDVVGKLLKEAKAALKVGDTKKASQLVQEAQNKLNALDVGSANKASNTAGKGTSANINNGTTGTVWDSVKATQPNYPGSVIPKSFEMTLPNGQKVWIHGNATEHIAEYAQFKAKDYTPEAVRLSSQQQLNSLQGALNSATKNGVEYNKLITIGGWELKLAPPRQLGELPAVIHARPVK